MRRLRLLAAGLLALAGVATGPATRPAGGRALAQPAAPAAAPATPAAADALVVPAGAVREGDLVVLRGDVDVRGQVRGDVTALFGDVTVGPGGRVTGAARAVFGTARVAGGRVEGPVRSGWRRGGEAAAARPRPHDPLHAAGVTLAWFAVLFVLGVGLLAGASPQLDAVAGALEEAPGRAIAVGLAGQLALAPALLVLVAALFVTVIGWLAIPLAVVAFVLAAVGLLTLGFLTAAFVLGRWAAGDRPAVGRPRAAAARGPAVRALAVGTAAFLALWVGAALLGGVPAAGLLVRAVALAATWLAVTAGFGAALRSRGRARRRATAPTPADDRGGVPAWQTPTPITGVVAARRPVAAAPAGGAGANRG